MIFLREKYSARLSYCFPVLNFDSSKPSQRPPTGGFPMFCSADTPIPGMEVPFTWQASLELNAKLYSALGQCNLDKAGIRSVEKGRQSIAGKPE